MTDRTTSTKPRSQSADRSPCIARTSTSADGTAPEHGDSELTAKAREVLAGTTLAQDVLLHRVYGRNGCFVSGANVMVSRCLESAGLVVLTDNGAMRGLDGRSDGERWYVAPADTDLGREVARLIAEGGAK